MATRVVMPEMGEGVIEGTIARWLKQEGDEIEEFEPILEIETDKVTTEATAEVAGTLLRIYVDEGETVPVGTLLAYIGESGETAPEAANGDVTETAPLQEVGEATTDTGEDEAAAAESAGSRQPATREEGAEELPYADWASPVVRRIAAEHDVDLDKVQGTGRGGRTTKRDIMAYLEQRERKAAVPPTRPEARQPEREPQEAPQPTRASVAQVEAIPGELLPLSNMRRRIAEHMVQSKHTSPHVTTVFEVDFSAVVAHRHAQKEQYARDGIRLTFTPYIVAAVVRALKEHPLVNSSWQEDGVLIKKEINVGMATALDDGLIVPVIKNADHYNLLGLARQVNDLAERARGNQLKPTEVQGGTFSITNHGVSGSLFATPIINQPQCGILGIGKIEKRVKVIDDAIAVRPLAYVSFTFDHRILDGASADYFVASFKEQIETWE